MRAVGVGELPEPRMCRGGCAYEAKFDGWRSIVFVRSGGVYLQSRRSRDLTPYFPDVVAALRECLPPGTVVDGELVVWDTAAGRTTFSALLGRITAGRRLAREAADRPANLVLFDVLADAGEVLTGLPPRQRRARLEHLLVDAPPTLTLCPQTSDVELARTWFDELAVTGAEGLVVKDLASVYRVGGRGSSWWKYKRRVTVEAIVGGITGALEDPRALLLGRSRRPRPPTALRRPDRAARTEPTPGDRPDAHRRPRRLPVAATTASGLDRPARPARTTGLRTSVQPTPNNDTDRLSCLRPEHSA
jgi:ATP-dependent DNA ligase